MQADTAKHPSATPGQGVPGNERRLTGWRVLGFNSYAMAPAPIRVPVLATGAAAAMAEASSQHPGFQPVGAMSEDEIKDDLQRINSLRAS